MAWEVAMVGVVQIFSYSKDSWQVELVEFIVRVLSVILDTITVCVEDDSWLKLGLQHDKLLWTVDHLNVLSKLALLELRVAGIQIASSGLHWVIDHVISYLNWLRVLASSSMTVELTIVGVVHMLDWVEHLPVELVELFVRFVLVILNTISIFVSDSSLNEDIRLRDELWVLVAELQQRCLFLDPLGCTLHFTGNLFASDFQCQSFWVNGVVSAVLLNQTFFIICIEYVSQFHGFRAGDQHQNCQ